MLPRMFQNLMHELFPAGCLRLDAAKATMCSHRSRKKTSRVGASCRLAHPPVGGSVEILLGIVVFADAPCNIVAVLLRGFYPGLVLVQIRFCWRRQSSRAENRSGFNIFSSAGVNCKSPVFALHGCRCVVPFRCRASQNGWFPVQVRVRRCEGRSRVTEFEGER